MQIDFAAIAARAIAAADSMVPRWLPDGVKEGAEWSARNPLRADGKRGSFKVNLKSGLWSEFATGDAGNDLISLYAYLHGVGQGDAAKAVADELGMRLDEPVRVAPPAPEETDTEWRWISIIVPDHPPPPQAHIKRGRPAMRWAYRSIDGDLLGFILRFTTSDGGKEILPLTLWQNKGTREIKWRWAGFPVPRPLYNLPALKADGPVLIVEGEKACDAAMRHCPDQWACVTWPGGAKAINKVDWQLLAGREITLWPDKDLPGLDAMRKLAEILRGIGCTVGIVDVNAAFPDAPAGFDIADMHDDVAVRDVAKGLATLQAVESISTPQGASAKIVSDEAGLFSKSLIWGNAGLKDCRENVIYFLRDHPAWRGVLAVDEFANRIVFRKPGPLAGATEGTEWSANFDAELALWLAEQPRTKLLVRSLDTIGHAVKYVAQLAKFHPVREYLNALKWDKGARVDGWMHRHLGTKDGEYERLAGRYFLLNMVARIFDPGCIMRSVPVLEGEQNKGKSTALRTLAAPWFSDTIFQVNSKDAYQQIQGIWLYEISELESFGRVEATAVKAFISSVEDNYRAPYERANERHKRQTVFAGTTNAKEWLKDWTGNTRFWPIEVEACGPIDLAGLAKVRDQLFAEAVALYRKGERRYPTRELEDEHFRPHQDLRMIVHPWVEKIADWLIMGQRDEVTINDILVECLRVDMARMNPTGSEAQTVGKVMASLGWDKVRRGKERQYVWRKPKVAKLTATREQQSGMEAGDVPF